MTSERASQHDGAVEKSAGAKSLEATSSPSSTVATAAATFVTSRSPSSSSLHSSRSSAPLTRLRYRHLVQPITPTELEPVEVQEGQQTATAAGKATDHADGTTVMRYPRVELSSLDLAKPRIYTRLLYFFEANSSSNNNNNNNNNSNSKSNSNVHPSSSSASTSSSSSSTTGKTTATGTASAGVAGVTGTVSSSLSSVFSPTSKKGSSSKSRHAHHYHYHQSPFMDPMLLQASLALVLTDFFPLAGRLYKHSDQPATTTFTANNSSDSNKSSKGQFIECNDRGVLFAVADTSMTMSQIRQGDFQDAVLPPQLFPVGLYPASLRDPPLLGVQLTYTQDQSLIMGVAMDSSVMDAASLVSFMEAWSKITQGKDYSPYPPVLEREFLERQGEEHGTGGAGGVYRHQRLNDSPPPPILFDNNFDSDLDRGLGDADLHSEDGDHDGGDDIGQGQEDDSEQDLNLERAQKRMQSLHLESGIPTVVVDHIDQQQQQPPLEAPVEDIGEAAASRDHPSAETESLEGGSQLHLFHFSPEQLERIKKLASEQNIAAAACAADDKEISDKWVSTGDSLIAYLWKMSTITRRMEPDCKLMCGVVMDIRNRTTPVVPEGFVGNAILSIFVQMPVHSLLTTPLSLPSRLLRDELLLQTPEQIRSAIHWIQKQDHPHLIEADSNNPFGYDFMVWSFRKLDMYSPDFGQGRPCKVRIGRGGFGGGEGMCIIMDSSPLGGRGVDVYLGLEGEHLQDFEKVHRGFMEGLLEPGEGSGSGRGGGNDWEMVY